jgi:hypothetical protein
VAISISSANPVSPVPQGENVRLGWSSSKAAGAPVELIELLVIGTRALIAAL